MEHLFLCKSRYIVIIESLVEDTIVPAKVPIEYVNVNKSLETIPSWGILLFFYTKKAFFAQTLDI